MNDGSNGSSKEKAETEKRANGKSGGKKTSNKRARQKVEDDIE